MKNRYSPSAVALEIIDINHVLQKKQIAKL